MASGSFHTLRCVNTQLWRCTYSYYFISISPHQGLKLIAFSLVSEFFFFGKTFSQIRERSKEWSSAPISSKTFLSLVKSSWDKNSKTPNVHVHDSCLCLSSFSLFDLIFTDGNLCAITKRVGNSESIYSPKLYPHRGVWKSSCKQWSELKKKENGPYTIASLPFDPIKSLPVDYMWTRHITEVLHIWLTQSLSFASKLLDF